MMRILYDTVSGNMYSFDDTVVSKMIGDTCYDKSEIDRKISAVLKIQGQKATKNELPLTGNERGFVWVVAEDNSEYVWLSDASTGTLADWEKLGPVIDLSGYYTKEEINTLLGTVPEGKTIVELLGMDGTEAKSLKELVVDAQSKADEAYTLAGQAKSAAETADDKAVAAQNTANQAVTDAANAKTAADTADGKAVAAQNTANQAVSDAAAAKSAADNAQADATQALTNAATADGKAEAAQTDATKALTDAATADGKAEAAQTDATKALTDAATADGKAEAAGTLAGEAKTAAETADGKAEAAQTDATKALSDAANADAKAVAAQNKAGAALPADTFETWKTGNTEAINAAKKAGDDAQTDLNNYKTANDLAVAAAKKAGDDAQSDLNNYKTSNDLAVAAAKKSGDDAQSDLNNYKTSNDLAVAAAKKAGDDAQSDLNNYKTSNDSAVQAAAAAASTADGKAVAAQEAVTTLGGTVSANKTLADQIFANLGSVIGNIGYDEFTGSEFVEGTTYYVRHSTGVFVATTDEEPQTGTTYYTRNSDVVATSIQNLFTQLSTYIAEHKVLPADTSALDLLPDFVWQTVSTGEFSRYMTYYYDDDGEKVALVRNTDYVVEDDIAEYIAATERTLYIKHIPSMSEMRASINAISTILNLLITAHKAEAAAEEP